jgi:hypothetical protein
MQYCHKKKTKFHAEIVEETNKKYERKGERDKEKQVSTGGKLKGFFVSVERHIFFFNGFLFLVLNVYYYYRVIVLEQAAALFFFVFYLLLYPFIVYIVI